MAKPRKVEDPAGAYSKKAPDPKKTGAPEIRYADAATFQRAADKVFKTHREVLRKLAQ